MLAQSHPGLGLMYVSHLLKTFEYLYFSEVFPFLSIEAMVIYYAHGSEFWLILVFKFFGRQVSFRKAFLSNESIKQVKFLKKKTLRRKQLKKMVTLCMLTPPCNRQYLLQKMIMLSQSLCSRLLCRRSRCLL